jgi:hypothetical protein
MKAYGRKKKDFGCCPGHDKFPSDKYNTKTSVKAHTRDTRLLHKKARKAMKTDFKKEQDENS